MLPTPKLIEARGKACLTSMGSDEPQHVEMTVKAAGTGLTWAECRPAARRPPVPKTGRSAAGLNTGR